MRKNIAISELKGEAVTMGDILDTIEEEATKRATEEMQVKMDAMQTEKDAEIAEKDARIAKLEAELEELKAGNK